MLSAPPAALARALNAAASIFLPAPLCALDARHKSSLTASVTAVGPDSPADAPRPSLVAPAASAVPALGSGCRPSLGDGTGVASAPVVKMLRAASRIGSGRFP